MRGDWDILASSEKEKSGNLKHTVQYVFHFHENSFLWQKKKNVIYKITSLGCYSRRIPRNTRNKRKKEKMKFIVILRNNRMYS